LRDDGTWFRLILHNSAAVTGHT